MTIAPMVATAHPTMPRIACVDLFKEGPTAPFLAAFRSRMNELGGIDGRTVRIEPFDVQGRQEKLATIMRELVDSQIAHITGLSAMSVELSAKRTQLLKTRSRREVIEEAIA